jgi:hypothetical protein
MQDTPPFKHVTAEENAWVFDNDDRLCVRFNLTRGWCLVCLLPVASGTTFAKVDLADLRRITSTGGSRTQDGPSDAFSRPLLDACYGACCGFE